MARTHEGNDQPQPPANKTDGSSDVLTQDVQTIQDVSGQKTDEGKQHTRKHGDSELTLTPPSLRLGGRWFDFAHSVLFA